MTAPGERRSSRRRVPEVPRRALRDYENARQGPAIWTRLAGSLRERRATSPRPARALAWLPALGFALGLFGSGVYVGARFFNARLATGMRAEPAALSSALHEPRAAGSTAARATSAPEVSAARVKATSARSRHHASRSSSPTLADAPPFAPDEDTRRALPPPSAVTEWRRLLEVGDFAGAKRALDEQGGFDVAIAHASPSELMSLVDVARASGERDQAISALRQVLYHPDAPEAPLAAWTLGNLLDQAGDEPGAAQAFALYRRLSPAGDFAEDAAARQIDGALAAGNAELVTQLVADYARDFPRGRRLAEFRKAERTLARDAGASAGPSPTSVDSEPEDEADETEPPVNPSPSPTAATP